MAQISLPRRLVSWRFNPLLVFLRFGFLFLAAVVTALPFLWLGSTALKTPAQVFGMPLTIIPSDPQWSNFREAWSSAPFTRYYLNTLFIAIHVHAIFVR